MTAGHETIDEQRFGPVTVTSGEGVATVLVDHPPVNAMGRDVLSGLEQAIALLHGRTEVRAVVLAAAGTKAFFAGADIAEFQALQAQEGAMSRRSAWARSVLDGFPALRQPVIAAVQAHAVGGGLEIALACDLIVAEPTVRFGLPEVKLGLIPGGGGTQRLPRRVGVGVAREMLFLGSVIDAERALDVGLVDRLAAPGAVLGEAQELAARIAALPRVAVQCIKRAVDDDLAAGLERERALFLEAFGSEDFSEGYAAFLEKREPRFTHR
ncbi:MAG TPA: enoyl-CoA hydratase-related protein [Solirubrobacteraceae bacterium]|nr:enoyl-CoA hydratase-related protein [Solirubrobacteraceae bacterium]